MKIEELHDVTSMMSMANQVRKDLEKFKKDETTGLKELKIYLPDECCEDVANKITKVMNRYIENKKLEAKLMLQ